MSQPAVETSLAEAAEGLRFRSETDHPFEVVRFPDATLPELTPAALLEALDRPADTRVEEVTLAHLFRNVAPAQAWQDDDVRAEAPRYENLMHALETRLEGVRVFRVGAIEIDVYILGRSPSGGWAGLRTFVVET